MRVFYHVLMSTAEHPFSRDVKLNRQDGLARRHQPASVLSYPSLCTMAIDWNSHGSREGSQACPSTAAFHHTLPSTETDLAAATETDASPPLQHCPSRRLTRPFMASDYIGSIPSWQGQRRLLTSLEG